MKTALLLAVSVSLLAASVQAQSPTTTRRSRVRTTQDGTFVAPRVTAPNAAAIAPTSGADGVIPRAIRSGNPLQMINPFAPAEYGGSQEVVRHENGDPYQNPKGIKFVSYTF